MAESNWEVTKQISEPYLIPIHLNHTIYIDKVDNQLTLPLSQSL